MSYYSKSKTFVIAKSSLAIEFDFGQVLLTQYFGSCPVDSLKE